MTENISHGLTDNIWDIIEDILDSVKLAEESGDGHVYQTVKDYVVNTYGDD